MTIQLGKGERLLLGLGSALGSLYNPRRADLIATLGEATAEPFFINRLRDQMLRSQTGRRILREQPRIKSHSLDVLRLRGLREGTVGREYVAWLDKHKVSPDTRLPVRYIADPELAYVMQRYRECHDFYHALLGLSINVQGEAALKLFEWQATRLPMTLLSAVGGFLRVKAPAKRRLLRHYFPWAMVHGAHAQDLINVYWEEELESMADELRGRLGIAQPGRR